jgi:cyclohexanecarboxylate-CoA ligase
VGARRTDPAGWRNRPLASYLDDSVARDPDRLGLVAYSGDSRTALTYRRYDDETSRVAQGLRDLGIGTGDVVAVQLPNWWQFGPLIHAIQRLGAVYSGIGVAYGARETRFILGRTDARVVVIPARFRGIDHVGTIGHLLDHLPRLEHVVVVEGEAPDETGWLTFDELRSRPGGARPRIDPNALAHIGFSSGTTGEPKGIMNSHNTLDAVLEGFIRMHGGLLDQHLSNLIPSPITHHTGFLWGLLMSARVGGTSVLMDAWNAERALEIIEQERVTGMWAAPTFLQDLLYSQRLESTEISSLEFMCIPGAPIPRRLVPQARERLKAFVIPAWGMTEYGIGLSGSRELDRELMERTDGVPTPGAEVRLVGPEGNELGDEVEGELEIRGAGLFLGYYKRPDLTEQSFDDDGWFRTGDRAVRYAARYFELTGRSKDIVIRGGENIPVVEVENLLHHHPNIRDVAIVGYPDQRLGERACAFVVPRPGKTVTLYELIQFLLERGLSRHFLPERLEVSPGLPYTSSGKIQKFKLREQLNPPTGGDSGTARA